MEARREVERAEFETITRRLIGRAAVGRGRVAAVGREDAEDVVQDAWEKLVRRGMTLPGGDALEAHVHEALVDVSGDHRRARRRKKVVPPERIVPLEAVSDHELGLEHSEDGNLAGLAVRELYETTVALVGESTVAYAVLDALGFSEKEIATKLEVTEAEAGALRKRVARSRAAIAEAINGRLEATKEDH